VAALRAQLLDLVLTSFHETAISRRPGVESLALIANGGYGRGLLNPGSDIDLLFLLPKDSHRLPADVTAIVEEILYLLFDLDFKVGHASRSIAECIKEGRLDPVTRTSLFDARLLAGDQPRFHEFRRRFRKDCIDRDREKFFEERRNDIHSRYRKFDSTVFLQEPNIKESPGGMRDFHNLLWISDALFQTRELEALLSRKILTASAAQELTEGFDFLHRVRNGLHYHTGKASDILTLRFQGILADAFAYPEKSKLRRIEAFMRDYYRHTRNIHQYTNSVFEIAEIETDGIGRRPLPAWLPFSRKPEHFDGFIARDGRLYPEDNDIFVDDPSRLLRLFLHCQKRELSPAPPLRKLIKAHWDLIDKPFRYLKTNRDTFRMILEKKGQVARVLRMMHRCGVLGKFLPEFGALDCLVQHEFFHIYTADEHTLHCIDELDALLDTEDPEKQRYRQLLIDIEDPYALYLAMLLHDTGRAENIREHVDGSALLANKVCRRMQITGGRRKLLMFLVDHHLTLWRFATKRNIDDPDVVAEFAGLMKDRRLLDALLLFTYADSNGTNQEAWSAWKENLILQLHRSTRAFLKQGYEEYDSAFREELRELRAEVEHKLSPKHADRIAEHFEQMPKRYFRFRSAHSVGIHIRAVSQYVKRRTKSPDTPFEAAVQWIQHEEHGYTELTVVTRDRPLLLEKICCSLATHQINILSADVYTRSDGIVLDIFRVASLDGKSVTKRSLQLKVVDTFYQINQQEDYKPSEYLRTRPNFLRSDSTAGVVPFPVRAYLDNESDPNFTVIEIQAVDRIGLLHDLLHTINRHGLHTIHARISTEKGAALDTMYVRQRDNGKLADFERLDELREDLTHLLEPGDS
jgi:[protein-PII] uridylyltransferase